MNKEAYDAERFMAGFEDGIKLGIKIFADQSNENLFMTAVELQTLAGRDLSRFILMYFPDLPDAWYRERFRPEVIGTIKEDAALIRNYWYEQFGDVNVQQNSVVS